MKLRLVSAGQGALWVRQGFSVFFRRPMAFASLFGLFWLALMVVSLVPVLGALVAFGAMPLMSLGFMLATEQALRGDTPVVSVFWTPLQGDLAQRRKLLKLGLAYALCMVGLLLLWLWADGDSLQALRDAMTPDTPREDVEALAKDGRLLFTLFTPLVIVGLLSLPFWHAPALVHWGGLPVGKAVFFSTVACWRNRGALLVYGLCWIGVMLVATLVCTLLFALIGLPQLAPAAAVPLVLVLTTVFYASLFFTFVDSFELSAPSTGEASP